MELTTKEAIEKICPFRMGVHSSLKCVCDECMAWEWTEFKEAKYQGIVYNDYDRTYSIGTVSNGRKPVKGTCRLIVKK